MSSIDSLKLPRSIGGRLMPGRKLLVLSSTGGTISLLAACTEVDVRAVFSFGGEPNLNLQEVIDTYTIAPYNRWLSRENKLRSAIRYTPFIRSPTFFFEGAQTFPGMPG